MKGQTFDINSAIQMGNAIIGLIPRLIALAYFLCLVFLCFRVLRAALSKKDIPTMELAAIAVAFGVAVR